MEGLLNFIFAVQLTIGPIASASQLGLIPTPAEPVVLGVYLPVIVAYDQSPALEVAIDEIVTDYIDLVRNWNSNPVQYYP